ncbi:MAG: carboxypeptidase M32 [Phycisphaerales bacterium]|nr:carboxypeptidase M32 [Phycisphaerales bacterium]
MTTATCTAFDELATDLRESVLLSSTEQILGWDQETMMPEGGVEYRSRQLALLARLVAERDQTNARGELIAACEEDSNVLADPVRAGIVREARRDYTRACKVPARLVEELTKTASIAQHEWAQSRAANDFKRFQPWLEKLVSLLREKAACLGWDRAHGEPWDALADLYEPGCTAKMVEGVFTPLRGRLQTFVAQLTSATRKPSNAFNEFEIPIEKQEAFCKFVAAKIGFDFSRGRLDRSTHPFCSGSHCNDIRMTTRYATHCLNDGLGSTLHESGHGIYEQGLHFSQVGLPSGQSVSLGIHESQSRMWENQVGRSKAFWMWAQGTFKSELGIEPTRFSLDALYEAANIVEPGLIRVESDEATYNLHIMVRFEIERAILRGDLEVAGIPAEWNRLYRDYLGLTVPDDRRGCMQDIHWSMGSMGYFPTYTLGNLYAAQFFEAAKYAIPDLDAQITRGEFGALKTWLNREIHQHGRQFSPTELVMRVTGKPLSAEPLMRHLEGKLRPLYGM